MRPRPPAASTALAAHRVEPGAGEPEHHVSDPDSLRRLLDALDRLPVRALVTLGPAVPATALEPPPNVELVAWRPHCEVLPRADLVVTHGGHGTVATALRYGVPVLCLPMERDQRDVAARARGHHAGLVASTDASVPTLRALIARGVQDVALRDGARRLAAAMAGDDPRAAVREVIAVTSRPA